MSRTSRSFGLALALAALWTVAGLTAVGPAHDHLRSVCAEDDATLHPVTVVLLWPLYVASSWAERGGC